MKREHFVTTLLDVLFTFGTTYTPCITKVEWETLTYLGEKKGLFVNKNHNHYTKSNHPEFTFVMMENFDSRIL